MKEARKVILVIKTAFYGDLSYTQIGLFNQFYRIIQSQINNIFAGSFSIVHFKHTSKMSL